jgi:putative membrane protein
MRIRKPGDSEGTIMGLLLSWLVMTLAVLLTAYLLPGVAVSGFGGALVTALVLGIVNALIRPVLMIIALPITVLTLGLFALVINALLILLVARIVPGFEVANFWWALAFSVIVSIVGGILGAIVP